MKIAEITYTKAWSKWVPNDARVESVECNIYIRRAFGKIPDHVGKVILRIWTEEPKTENSLHYIVASHGTDGSTTAYFHSRFTDRKKNTLTAHAMSPYWMKVIDPNNELTGGSSFWFELEIVQ